MTFFLKINLATRDNDLFLKIDLARRGNVLFLRDRSRHDCKYILQNRPRHDRPSARLSTCNVSLEAHEFDTPALRIFLTSVFGIFNHLLECNSL